VTERIPERFRGAVVRRIGQGGEAIVYQLTGERALRVFRGAPHGRDRIADFYRWISGGHTSFALPEIIEQGEEEGIFYSVDRLIRGRALHDLLPTLDGTERERALTSYTDAAFEIASLPMTNKRYGEFLRDDDSIAADSWNAYLMSRMRRSLAVSTPWLSRDLPRLNGIVDALTERIDAMPPVPKTLAHGDYFPGNVLIGDDFSVSGVIDFGPLTVIGDPWLDLASALVFLEVSRPGYRPADTEFVRDRLAARVGGHFLDRVTTYAGWYAIRFSPYRDDDSNLYAWCVHTLDRVANELGI
jgi:hypothetical protein